MARLRAVVCRAAGVGILVAGLASAGEPGFAEWLDTLRRDAGKRGISAATLQAALTGLAPIPRVIELDRRQPEFTLRFRDYLARVVTPGRVERGRERLAEHRALLEEIGTRYGVEPRVVVALWGIETDYGRLTGGFPVIPALATLAHDARRSAYFREELLAALRILDEGHVALGGMQGSWAGAMGQSQFMPSSFLRYAVDHDGDGRRDIWTSHPDVFASIANYLTQAGWRAAQTWGREVRLPARFDPGLVGLGVERPRRAWQELGVRLADGADLPVADESSSVVLPEGLEGPALLVETNLRTLMQWNRSLSFAVAVGYLSDYIGDPERRLPAAAAARPPDGARSRHRCVPGAALPHVSPACDRLEGR